MIVFVVTIALSACQIAALLLLARVLGANEYASYSLAMAIGLTTSACLAEWQRLIVARYSGAKGKRFQAAILRTTAIWITRTAVIALVGTVFTASVVMCLLGETIAKLVFASGLFAVGSILADSSQTYLRFNGSARQYIGFVSARSLGPALTMLIVAAHTKSGFLSAIAFGLSAACIGAYTMRATWFYLPGRIDHRRLRSLLPNGFSMATGAITTNATITLVRVSIASVLPSTSVGAFFVSLDLATRGLNVLGLAYNTWATKKIYIASHRSAPSELSRVIGITSPLFSLVWLSAGVCGISVAFVAPTFLSKSNGDYQYAPVTIANLTAVTLLWMKLFNIDTILNSLKYYRVVVIGSLAPLAIMIVSWTFGVGELWSFPIAVTLSLGLIGVTTRARVITLALVEAVAVGVMCFSTLWLIEVISERQSEWTFLAALIYLIGVVAIVARILHRLHYNYRLTVEHQFL